MEWGSGGGGAWLRCGVAVGVMGQRARALRSGTGSRDRTPTQTGENGLPLRSPDQRLHRLTSPGKDRLRLALVVLRVLALIAFATRLVWVVLGSVLGGIRGTVLVVLRRRAP